MSDEVQKLEDWWMPYQVELVKDNTRVWQHEVFKSSTGVWLPLETGRLLSKAEEGKEMQPGATLDEAAWDHEHCELCFATISDHGEHQRDGYTDGKIWVCATCYKTYIAPYRHKKDDE